MRPARARALALTLAVGLVFHSGSARAELEGEEDLDALRAAIAESRERVGRHEAAERDLLERLEALDRGFEALERSVDRAKAAAREARARLAEYAPRLKQVRADLERTRRAMARRAVALYKAGEVGPIRVLFTSSSLPELFARVAALERLLDYDAALVRRHKGELDRLARLEDEARDAELRRDEALRDLDLRSVALEEEREAKHALMLAVRSDRTRERSLLVELERAARALEETLATLGDQSLALGGRLDGSGFAGRKGRLPWPARGRVRARFGKVVDAEYQTEVFRKGVEVASGRGDSVRSVAKGQVRYAGWFRGYGKIVIVDHGDAYFTVSGHLDEVFVEVGDIVASGDTLGTVGETGSLSGPGLYFELRQAGSPMDPMEWLE